MLFLQDCGIFIGSVGAKRSFDILATPDIEFVAWPSQVELGFLPVSPS